MNYLLALAAGVTEWAERVADALRWLSPTIARLTVGLVFLESGWGKLQDLQKVTDFFTELNLPAPAFQATLASTTEFVCGGLLLAGFATRLVVVPLIITMVVAIRTALWNQVDGLSSLVGLLEFSYIALLVGLGTSGAGPFSVDWLVSRGMRRLAAAPAANRSASRALA